MFLVPAGTGLHITRQDTGTEKKNGKGSRPGTDNRFFVHLPRRTGPVPGSEILHQFLIITGIVRVDLFPGHHGDSQDDEAEHEREEEGKVKACREHGELDTSGDDVVTSRFLAIASTPWVKIRL